MTANLQTKITVRQAAQIMNVSERNVYKMKQVLALHPDLEDRIWSGELSLHKAYLTATVL